MHPAEYETDVAEKQIVLILVGLVASGKVGQSYLFTHVPRK